MNAAVKAKLNKALWLITGFAALCVGLGAIKINVLGMLHMEKFDTMLRYIVGLAGMVSVVMFFKECSKK